MNSLIMQAHGDGRLYLACFLIVWVSGFAAAFLDSLPSTTTLLPVIVHLSQTSGLPLRMLIWSLSLGVCMGANATIIGAPVNVVAAGMLEQAGSAITFGEFIKFGAPVAVLSLFVSTIYLFVKIASGWY
eukprot:TRINITY_DN15110_c0_g1_i2.p2 TRINITY_DN15110_c0_g1~~TRINITY_DN15110_c0_g1_i2.p2  ORF type:complete len:129 (-),score=23.19 TRINITY_DN15110_c0_g1_i2:244-630(-)